MQDADEPIAGGVDVDGDSKPYSRRADETVGPTDRADRWSIYRAVMHYIPSKVYSAPQSTRPF